MHAPPFPRADPRAPTSEGVHHMQPPPTWHCVSCYHWSSLSCSLDKNKGNAALVSWQAPPFPSVPLPLPLLELYPKLLSMQGTVYFVILINHVCQRCFISKPIKPCANSVQQHLVDHLCVSHWGPITEQYQFQTIPNTNAYLCRACTHTKKSASGQPALIQASCLITPVLVSQCCFAIWQKALDPTVYLTRPQWKKSQLRWGHHGGQKQVKVNGCAVLEKAEDTTP